MAAPTPTAASPPPLTPAPEALWQLYSGNRPLLCTWSEFDHDGRQKTALGNADQQVWWGPIFLSSTGQQAVDKPSWPAGKGLRGLPGALPHARGGGGQAVATALGGDP